VVLMPLFVLVHSPSVGPSTWEPVAGLLPDAGHEAVVPSLLGVADGGPPYWPIVAAAVREGLSDADASRPVVLVAHSNAGLFVPVITNGIGRAVACSIFADASVPPIAGSTPVAEGEFLPFLRDLVGEDGLLPQWTSWWGEEDIAPMLPDPRLRQVITAERPGCRLSTTSSTFPSPQAGTTARAGTCCSARATRASLKRRVAVAGRSEPCQASTCTRWSIRPGSQGPCWTW
jgi:hypothetical protein